MRVRIALYGLALCVGLAPVLSAQDAAKVDPTHYTVISDNAQVRILKAHYGPHEKSVMHAHPDAVAVFLTDGMVRFTFPDGKTEDQNVKAGTARYTPHTVHMPENLSDKDMEVMVIELKPHMAKPMATKMSDDSMKH
jgi:mannose-6-phosphate isomerase-like protein (cupin superfamily)